MSKKLMLVAVMIGLVSVLALPMIASAELTIGSGFGSSLPTTELPVVVGSIINAALGLLGLVAVCIILLGGFKWMTAMGNEESVKKAKSLLIQGVIGLIIIVCAYAIAQFVLTAINRAAA